MSDQDIFDNDNPNPNPEATPPAQNDPFSDKLKGIVNEDGQQKYDTVEKALDALKASQEYIKELKSKVDMTAQEKAQMAAELEKMGSIDDFVKRVSPQAEPKATPEATPPVSNGLSEEQVAKLIQQQLNSQKVSSEQTQNLDSVISQLTEKYGDKTSEHIKQRAEELGTTPADLKQLAKQNPKLAMAALGGEAKSSPSPSRPSMSSTPQKKNDNEAPVYEKSVARGGFTDRQLADRWREVGAYTHKRLGVETSN